MVCKGVLQLIIATLIIQLLKYRIQFRITYALNEHLKIVNNAIYPYHLRKVMLPNILAVKYVYSKRNWFNKIV